MRVRSRLLHGFYLRNALIEPLKGRVSLGDKKCALSPDAMEILLFLVNRSNEFVDCDELAEAIWEQAGDRASLLAQAIDELRTALADDAGQPSFIEGDISSGLRLLVDPYSLHNERIPKDTRDTEEHTQLLQELLQRGVVQTGLTYLVVGWLLVQVSDVLFDKLPLPQWSSAFVAWLVIAGFPIALALSWFLEFTSGKWRLQREPSKTKRQRFLSRTHFSVLLGLMVAGGAVATYQATVGLPESGRDIVDDVFEVDENTIAVLPFQALGEGGERVRIFAQGLAEDVGNRLSRIPGMRAASSRDARSVPPEATSGDVRRRLRVAYYVQGSVRLLQDSIRVSIQLIDSDNGFELASRTFDRNISEFFSLQDEITSLTVANLRLVLPAAAASRGVPPLPSQKTDIDAYYHYREGVEILLQPVTADSVEAALDSFERSLEIDSEYAAAFAGKCQAYLWRYRVANDPGDVDLAERECGRALGLSPNLDVVYEALGRLYMLTGRDTAAEAAFAKAMAIFESNVPARLGLAQIHARRQEFVLAEDLLEEAIELQPGNWAAYNTLGFYHFQRGQYEEAAKAYGEVVAIDRTNMTGFGNLGAALMMSGDFSRAITAFERSIEIEPQDTAYSNLGMLHYYRGEFDQAIAAFRESIELAPNDYIAWSNLGDALFFVGDMEASQLAFEKAIEFAETQLNVNPQDAELIESLAWANAMLGNLQVAQDLIAKSLQLSSSDPYTHFSNALILFRVAIGSSDTIRREKAISDAFDALAAAKEKGYPVKLLAAEPYFESLKDDPRFRRLAESG